MFFILISAVMVWAGETSQVLVEELDGAFKTFEALDEKPHYASISVEEREEFGLVAEMGALVRDRRNTIRSLDVDMRVGSAELDSTHPLRGFSSLDGDERRMLLVPQGDGLALRHTVRSELDRSYREAAERVVLVRGNRDVKVAEEDQSADFEPREAVSFSSPVSELVLDEEAWRLELETISARLSQHPEIHASMVGLTGVRSVKTFVDSEGSQLEHGRLQLRLSLRGSAVASDGDVVKVFRSADVHHPDRLPTSVELRQWTDDLITRLIQLKAAPRGEPYSGPVLLRGRATGVFVHEVFGHRVEGHRQKREYEGKTFLEYLGEEILPDYITISDDPQMANYGDVDLNGHYEFDDEGVKGERVSLVEKGVFKGFLMHRSPIRGFPHSNGHGRRSSGNPPGSRMGNTIVQSSTTHSSEKLRESLLDQIREQGLEYGYIVDSINGGFTLTGRMMPNAFNVRANASWRVYADGRPDELVRGIDLVGTPLIAFSSILGTDDAYEVFNGTCGAESGWVPVSAVAPGVLFRRLEFQLKEKGQERPPLLSKPELATDGAASLEGVLQ